MPDNAVPATEKGHRSTDHNSKRRRKKPGKWRKFKHRLRESLKRFFSNTKESSKSPFVAEHTNQHHNSKHRRKKPGKWRKFKHRLRESLKRFFSNTKESSKSPFVAEHTNQHHNSKHRRKKPGKWRKFKHRLRESLKRFFSNTKESSKSPFVAEHTNQHHNSKHRRKKPGKWRKFKHRLRESLKRFFSNTKESSKSPFVTEHTHQHHKSKHRRKKPGKWRKFKHLIRTNIQKFISKKLPNYVLAVKQTLSGKQQLKGWKKWWRRFRKNPWKAIFTRKRHSSSSAGYHYIHRMTREESKAIKLKRREQKRENMQQLFSSPDLRKKMGIVFLQSTAYFLLSFMIIYLVYQAVTILMASSFNIPVIWYYYRIKFAISDFSPLYTRANLIIIFAAGPVVSLMMAFGFMKLFFTQNAFLQRFQRLYLWGFINGINMFFGAYIAGFFTQTEFIYAAAWLFMSKMYAIEEMVFAVISFAVLLIVGRTLTPLFLISSGTIKLIKPQFRQFYIITGIILPWFAGVIILFLITLPNYYLPLVLKTITPLFLLAPSLYRYNNPGYANIYKTGVIQRDYFKWSILIALVALLFFYRAILSFGLKFG